MSEDNPYAVSAECTGGEVAREIRAVMAFRIDGDMIVCGRHVALPPVCVLRGVTDNLVLKHVSVQYGAWRLVLRQHTVTCACFVSQDAEKEMKRIRMAGKTLLILGFLMMFGIPILANGSATGGAGVFAGIVFVVLSGMVNHFGQLPLKLHRHRGSEYWISGISRSFFETISGQVARLKLAAIEEAK